MYKSPSNWQLPDRNVSGRIVFIINFGNSVADNPFHYQALNVPFIRGHITKYWRVEGVSLNIHMRTYHQILASRGGIIKYSYEDISPNIGK